MNPLHLSNEQSDKLIDFRERHPVKALPFKTFADFGTEPLPKRHIFKGVMARGETSAWIAPPGGMKSALMASAAMCGAYGIDWFGKRNKERVGVVYFALERADLVARRLQAHQARMGLGIPPIAIVSQTIDLMTPRMVPNIVATIREAEICFELSVGIAIFDTFAKLIAAGGGDENSAKDQGAVFANIQRIKEQQDIHVALIGHTGKDESKGARGSNAILGDADIMVKITGDNVRTANIIKANELPEGPLFSFGSELHQFGIDEDGDPISVNIATEVDAQAIPTSESRLNKNQQTMFSILHAAGPGGLTKDQWNERARDAGLGTGRRADLHDYREQLKVKRVVRESGERWVMT